MYNNIYDLLLTCFQFKFREKHVQTSLRPSTYIRTTYVLVRNSSPVIIVVVVVVSRIYDYIIPGTEDFDGVACLDRDNDLQACERVVCKDRCVISYVYTYGRAACASCDRFETQRSHPVPRTYFVRVRVFGFRRSAFAVLVGANRKRFPNTVARRNTPTTRRHFF